MSHVDTTKTITHISLCAGYGGIDIGLKRAIPNLRTILFSEIEAFACANLVSKMEKGFLDAAAPIWTNLKTLPWDQFYGKVGILSGGFPCQPFSCAGKREGDEDPRHLFPFILDGIRRCRPSVVFLENVAGILSSRLAGDQWRDPSGTPVLLHVLRELERVGYRATAGIFSASEVGAPHQRKRVFIMAYCLDEGSQGWLRGWSNKGREAVNGHAGCGGAGIHGGWPSRPGQPQYEWEPPRVVENSKFIGRGRGNHGDEGGLCREIQIEGSCSCEVVNSSSKGLADTGGLGCMEQESRVPEAEGCEPTPPIEQSINSCGAKMGNATEQGCQGSRGTHDSGGQCFGSSESDRGGEQRNMEPQQWEAEPSVGGNPHGTACGVGHAELPESDHAARGESGTDDASDRELDDPGSTELNRVSHEQWKEGFEIGKSSDSDLYISCDNRTDELRLLGNGVLPATAELAFRTLWEELTK